ncbi:Inner membrane protein YbaL [compost metagenome]
MALLATLAIVLVAKSIAAFAIVWFFRYSMRTALTVSASLAQIGEFSFILAGLGLSLGLLPPEGRNLVLAGAIISITVNPFFFALSDRAYGWLAARPELLARLERRVKKPPFVPPPGATGLRGHAIVVGYGRVGAEIADSLHAAGLPVLAIERHQVPAEELRRRGIEVIEGDASQSAVLLRAALKHAALMVVAIPTPMEARTIVQQARAANPALSIVARTHTPEERSYLTAHGADRVVYAETELARALVRYALEAAGHAPPAAAGLYYPDKPIEMTERGPGG